MTTTGTTAGAGDIQRSLELLWGTGERPSRGPKPGLTLDRIVSKAIEVADAEGLAAVSMRRLSTELGTGTMSLYRYVPGKAELLDLMLDRAQDEANNREGESPADEGDWRAAVDSMARAYFAQLHSHPWLLKINQARTALGPSAVMGLELALRHLRGMGLSDPEMISVIITVNSYVEGLVRTHLNELEASQQTGLSEEQFWESQRPFLEQAMTSGTYPLMATLSEEAFGSEFDHFEFGLSRILDGFEVLVESRRADRDG